LSKLVTKALIYSDIMMKKFIPLNYMHLFNNEKNRKKYLEKSFVAVLNN